MIVCYYFALMNTQTQMLLYVINPNVFKTRFAYTVPYVGNQYIHHQKWCTLTVFIKSCINVLMSATYYGFQMQSKSDYFFSRKVEALLGSNTQGEKWADNFRFVQKRVPWVSAPLICAMLSKL